LTIPITFTQAWKMPRCSNRKTAGSRGTNSPDCVEAILAEMAARRGRDVSAHDSYRSGIQTNSIAISAAGAFRTDDGGKSWNQLIGAPIANIPDPTSEVGHCVHRMALHPSRPNTLFMQKHWDVMRTDDAGDSWKEVSGNLPTDFGFPIDVHAHEPETIYVVPIKSDSEHYPLKGGYACTAAGLAATTGKH